MNLSPAQALLLLIAYYKQPFNYNADTLELLTRFYLDGVANPLERERLQGFFDNHKDDVLSGYDVSTEFNLINDDASRRYFETHLAYESIRHGLGSISLEHLRYFLDDLKGFMMFYDAPYLQESLDILEGNYHGKKSQLYKEYFDFLTRIKNDTLFKAQEGHDGALPFSQTESGEKLKLIITWAFLSVRSGQNRAIQRHLPLNLYGKRTFSETQRGKILKHSLPENTGSNIQDLKTFNYGLMKSYMPLADGDIAKSETTFNFFKSSDQSKFDPLAAWVKHSFYRLVHPFSNSISGTALCVLRTMSYFRRQNRFWLNDSQNTFDGFYRAFASSIALFSGGHSLFEIVHVLTLPEVATEFSATNIIPDLNFPEAVNELNSRKAQGAFDLNLSKANISRLFLRADNNEAVTTALERTLAYNDRLLRQKKILVDVRQDKKSALRPMVHNTKSEMILDLKIDFFKKEMGQLLTNIAHRKIFEVMPTALINILQQARDTFSVDEIQPDAAINNTKTTLAFFKQLSLLGKDYRVDRPGGQAFLEDFDQIPSDLMRLLTLYETRYPIEYALDDFDFESESDFDADFEEDDVSQIDGVPDIEYDGRRMADAGDQERKVKKVRFK